MDVAQEPKAEEEKTLTQRTANRQTSIVVAGVFSGMGLGQAVGEGMAGEPAWLRVAAVAITSGLAAGLCGYSMARIWRASSTPRRRPGDAVSG